MTSISDLVERYRQQVKVAFEYATAELKGAPTSTFEIMIGHFSSLGEEFEAALTAATKRAEEAEKERDRLAEDRARFPNKPDDIGGMIEAHIGNLKAGKQSADNFARQWHARMLSAEASETALQAQVEALTKALEPSGETKAAYHGEFYEEVQVSNPEYDDGEDAEDAAPETITMRVPISWTTVKQIMKAISAQAALLNQGETDRLASAEDAK